MQAARPAGKVMNDKHHSEYKFLACLFMLLLSGMTFTAVEEFRSAQEKLQTAIHAEFVNLQTAGTTKFDALATNLNDRGDKLQHSVDSVAKPLAGTLTETQGLVHDARQQIKDELGVVNNVVANETAFMDKRVMELTAPTKNMLDDLAQVSADHLREKGNKASWPADVSGLLRATELFMGQSAKASVTIQEQITKQGPAVGAAAGAIATDAHNLADVVTKKITAPRSRMQKAHDWLQITLDVARLLF